MKRNFPPPSQLLLGAVLFLFVLSLGQVAQANEVIHKSYVCKYVGKPGVDEILQTGQNPIWVDNHSLTGAPDETFVGEEFQDAQGRSIVIVANTDKLDPEPTLSDCPSPETPSPTTPPPTTPPATTPPPTSATPTSSTSIIPPTSGTNTPTKTSSDPTPTPTAMTGFDRSDLVKLGGGFLALGLIALAASVMRRKTSDI